MCFWLDNKKKTNLSDISPPKPGNEVFHRRPCKWALGQPYQFSGGVHMPKPSWWQHREPPAPHVNCLEAKVWNFKPLGLKFLFNQNHGINIQSWIYAGEKNVKKQSFTFTPPPQSCHRPMHDLILVLILMCFLYTGRSSPSSKEQRWAFSHHNIYIYYRVKSVFLLGQSHSVSLDHSVFCFR